LLEAFEKDLGMNVLHAWGMTETSPLGTVSLLQHKHSNLTDEEKWELKAMQGYPLPLVEIRIMDDQGREMPWDGKTMGEVQVRGPWIIKQYFKMDNSPEKFTRDGWFRTGDVATIDEDGYMKITDRTKDLIKSGGEWISSVALENALMAHSKILEAAVIAVPDPKWSERPLAVVVPMPNAGEVQKDDVLDFLAERFPKFWLPNYVSVIQAIPRTSVGKFDKKNLRQQYAEGKLPVL